MKKHKLFIVGLSLLACAAPSHAQNKRDAPMRGAAMNDAATRETLPLRDVVLFSSGVGYFGRAGTVSGETKAALTFRADQINDVLKSLVVFDPQGTVRPVTYTTQDSIGRRLQASGLSLDSSLSLGQLLRQFQGAMIHLDVRKGRDVEGRLISVSTKNAPILDRKIAPTPEPAYIEIEYVNVLTAKGLVSTRLDEVVQVRLLDARLDRELRSSLELLSTGLNDQTRSVMLGFGGGATRQVRAGYLLETPVWKTSYRLVLDNKGDAKPYLQGWAIVENTTDSDWNDVNLSLVSGRPISFIQDLYQPLYVPRPRVAAQVIGSPTPQTYGETLVTTDEAPEMEMAADAPVAARPAPMMKATGGASFAREERMLSRREDIARVTSTQLQNAAQATGGARGDLFEYAISQPVTLPRQQAAMVPIIGENIGGEAVSIFNANDGFPRALNGFRLNNTSGLHLSGGPITVFQDGIYAGDAQINDLAPGEDRLLSYAVDLELVVDPDTIKTTQVLSSVQIRGGVLQLKNKLRRVRTYTFRNKSDHAKTVLVQQAIEPQFDLIEPATGVEKTADEYRFKVEVPAKGTKEITATTEQLVSSQVGIFDADINFLLTYARNTEASAQLKAALEEIVKRRQAIAQMKTQRAALEAEMTNINADQTRIRGNMERLDRNSDLYKEYVVKLTRQEKRIEEILTEIERLRDAETKAQNDLRAYIDGLTVE